MQEIQLTQGKVALVDDSDYPALSQFKWLATSGPKSKTYYAVRHVRIAGKIVVIQMHNAILGQSGIDHKDENGLNNQRFNLRDANATQQNANRSKVATARGKVPTSKYKGVTSRRNGTRWIAQIKINGKSQHLGTFLPEQETTAAKAYDIAAVYYFGEFAKLNFPLDTPQPNSVHLHE